MRSDLFDERFSFSVTETSDVREKVSVVDIAGSLVDIDSDLVRNFDQSSFESFDNLVFRELSEQRDNGVSCEHL